MRKNKAILVYHGVRAPKLVGRLWFHDSHERQSASFEYDRDWLQDGFIVSEVGQAVSEWRRTASVLGATRKEIDRMASAFEHDDLKQALESRRNPVHFATRHETRFSP